MESLSITSAWSERLVKSPQNGDKQTTLAHLSDGVPVNIPTAFPCVLRSINGDSWLCNNDIPHAIAIEDCRYCVERDWN